MDENQKFARRLMRMVQEDDDLGISRLNDRLNSRIDEQDKRAIASTVVEGHVPLCVAVRRGNYAVVELLVKDLKANTESRCDSCPGTVLYSAAIDNAKYQIYSNNKLEMVTELHRLGADINAVSSRSKMTAVNTACCFDKLELVRFLVRHGADINIPNHLDQTCLMHSLRQWELCEYLINKGAIINARDSFGDTALHWAIKSASLKTIQFLLNRGSDPYIKNNEGDDALQLTCLLGKQVVARKLFSHPNTTPMRMFESYILLGIKNWFSKDLESTEACWRHAIQIRMENNGVELADIGPSPICFPTMEINTVEQLQGVFQDLDLINLFTIENLLRIIGPSQKLTTDALMRVSQVLYRKQQYDRSFELLKFALRQIHERGHTWTREYLHVLEMLIAIMRKNSFLSEFHGAIDIFNTMAFETPFVNERNSYSKSDTMNLILSLVISVMRIDQKSEQMLIFKQVVQRLAESKFTDEAGNTFLHRAVEKFDEYQGVARMLLKCGANVNALDAANNTPLHLCTKRRTKFGSVRHDEKNKVIRLLLRYSAHVDYVNNSGDIAAKGLQLNLLNHVNLQCLAATAIRAHQVPYEGHIPQSLEWFVQMHGRR